MKKNLFSRIVTLSSCLLVLFGVAAPSVSAQISEEQRRSLQSGAHYFNLTDDVAPGVGEIPPACGTNLTGSVNEEKAFLFLRSKGLTAIQAAGVAGNLQAEGGFEPKRVEYYFLNSRGEQSLPGSDTALDTVAPPNATNDYDPPGYPDPPPGGYRGQPGYGIVQWSGGRKEGLTNFSIERNLPVYDLGLQLEFLWKS